MSDDDDFMADSDQEQYDFEYEDEDEDESTDIDVENKYYNAKQMKTSEPEEAISEFLAVVSLETEKGDWGFKGLKQAIKLEFKLAQYDKAVEHYRELLTYVKSAVTRNYSEKSINNMLDFIEKSSEDAGAAKCMEQFYQLTLESFKTTNNERLWLKTNIKLARLYLERKDYAQLTKKIRELHKACQTPEGVDDSSKGTYLLEIYAIEIQMHSDRRNNKILKNLYNTALKVKSAVPHPKIQGIIREYGGKMHMSEENWKEAQSDFFECFRCYDEAGSSQRIQVLKYLVLTTMLMKSDINPFDSQETKPYKNDSRIVAMTDLVDAYQHDNIEKYESVLQKNREEIVSDPFIAEHIDEVTRDMRTKAVLKIISPYTRFKTSFVAERLKIPVPEVEEILSFLVADGKTRGQIDIKDGTVTTLANTDRERNNALSSLSSAVSNLTASVFVADEAFRGVDEAPDSVMTLPLPLGSRDEQDLRKARHKAIFHRKGMGIASGPTAGVGAGPAAQSGTAPGQGAGRMPGLGSK